MYHVHAPLEDLDPFASEWGLYWYLLCTLNGLCPFTCDTLPESPDTVARYRRPATVAPLSGATVPARG